MKKVTLEEMLTRFLHVEQGRTLAWALTKSPHRDEDLSIKRQVDRNLERTDVAGALLAENLQMDSSSFGRMQIMVYGPGCTFKTWQECEGKWLKDLPSQRQYFTMYYEKP